MRLRGLTVFRPRAEIAAEAAFLCHAERYIGAVPLLFIVEDRMDQDAFRKSIFTDGVDLTESNALAGQHLVCRVSSKKSAGRDSLSMRNQFTFFTETEFCTVEMLIRATAWWPSKSGEVKFANSSGSLLRGAVIERIEDQAAAAIIVDCILSLEVSGRPLWERFQFRISYGNENGDPLVRATLTESGV